MQNVQENANEADSPFSFVDTMRFILDDNMMAANDDDEEVVLQDYTIAAVALPIELDCHVTDENTAADLWHRINGSMLRFIDIKLRASKDVVRSESNTSGKSDIIAGVIVQTPESLSRHIEVLGQHPGAKPTIPFYNAMSFEHGFLEYLRANEDFNENKERIPIAALGKCIENSGYKSKYSEWKFDNPIKIMTQVEELLECLSTFEQRCADTLAKLEATAKLMQNDEDRLGKTTKRCLVVTDTLSDLQISDDRLPIIPTSAKKMVHAGLWPLVAVSHVNDVSLTPESGIKSTKDLKRQVKDCAYACITVHMHRHQSIEFELGTNSKLTHRKSETKLNGMVGCRLKYIKGFIRVTEVLPTGLGTQMDIEVGDIVSGITEKKKAEDDGKGLSAAIVHRSKQDANAIIKLYAKTSNCTMVMHVHSNRFELVIPPADLGGKEAANFVSKRGDKNPIRERSGATTYREQNLMVENDESAEQSPQHIGKGGTSRMTHGFTVAINGQRMYVVSSIKAHSPAAKVVLLLHDVLTHIDGYSLRLSSVDEVDTLLQTYKTITLSISRFSAEHPPGYSHSARPLKVCCLQR